MESFFRAPLWYNGEKKKVIKKNPLKMEGERTGQFLEEYDGIRKNNGNHGQAKENCISSS